MKTIFSFSAVLMFQFSLYSQVQNSHRIYAHKVIVDSVLQTKAYTYLKVKVVNEKDSMVWMALPLFDAKAGDTYYYESGLQMGEFQSKELRRTFDQILFLGGLSTSAEVSEKTIVPATMQDTTHQGDPPVLVHTVVVKEVLQAGGYTYLRVTEGGREEWIAVVKIQASAGQTYTYDDAAPMKNFTSKELKRTFDEILFVARLTLSTDSKTGKSGAFAHKPANEPGSQGKSSGKIKNRKIDSVTGVVSIKDLLENKKMYSGKMVKIRGEITKYSSDILNTNWIHIEDGTGFSGRMDLTITTTQDVKVGDVLTFEGKISLDKDFGSGYFFDVIMEDAWVQK